MKYFFDTEFIEDRKTIDLISIGIVAEDGREFYGLNVDSDWTKANDWVRENVLIHLPQKPSVFSYCEKDRLEHNWLRHLCMGDAVLEFIGDDPNPEFWAYYADYDWVVFCQLFGTMMDLPKGFPMYCCDLKQECARLGNPKMPRLNGGVKHYALHDAREVKYRYEWLMNQHGSVSRHH